MNVFPKALTFLLVSILSINPFVVGQAPPQKQPDDAIKLSTELVVVDAQVLQKKTGRIVGGLSKSDFTVYEDGIKQEITQFSQDKLPISVVFLFDLTDSVRPVLKKVAAGAMEALQHLKPEDEVAVMTYAASAKLVQPFTLDHKQAADAIYQASRMESDEPAFFNEAVYQASAQSRKAANPISRRVIIWLTDNVPNSPSEWMRKHFGKSLPADAVLHTEQNAFDELFESGAVVSCLLERSLMSIEAAAMVKIPIFSIGRKKNHPGDVYHYVEETGGEVLKSSKEEVAGKLAELIDHIRTRYSLGYSPSNSATGAKLHKISLKLAPEVEKREGEIVVKARRGYYSRAKLTDQ